MSLIFTRQRQAWTVLSRFFGASFAAQLKTTDMRACGGGAYHTLGVRTPKGGRVSVSIGHLHYGDGEGSVDLIVSTPGREGTWGGGVWIGDVKGDDVVFIYDLDEVRQHLREWLLDPESRR